MSSRIANGNVAEALRTRRDAILARWVDRVRRDAELAQLREADEQALRSRASALLDALIATVGGPDRALQALDTCQSIAAEESRATLLRELMHLSEAAFASCLAPRRVWSPGRGERLQTLLDQSVSALSTRMEGISSAACSKSPGEELREAMEGARCGLWKLLPRTGELFWDAGCKRLFGLKPEHPVDYATFLESVHPEDRDRVQALVNRALDPASGGGYTCNYRFIDETHEEHWMEARGQAHFNAFGAPVCFSGIVLDITEHVRKEIKLAEATRLCEQLMGILGHDLRNPLSTIVCAAALLLNRTDLPDTAITSAQRIARSADRMTRMVRDLLDLTRYRTLGSLPIDPKPMDLGALCRSMIEEMEQAHPGRTIQLYERGRAVGVWDPDRIAQVLSNLLSNALNHSQGEAPVVVHLEARPEAVTLSVHNEGPAIPPDVRRSLLEPHWPGPQQTTKGRGSSGLGLGLFISQQVVRAHGGTINVASEEGRGTTLDVWLPVGQRA